MKYIKSFLLFALLVLFPFFSWYYLRGGINYRKQALKELENKTALPAEVQSIYTPTMEDQITLFNMGGSESSISKLNDQFGKVPEYRSIDLTQASDSLAIIARQSLGTYQDKAYLLVDDSMRLRRTYVENDEDLKLLVKHIATLLPFDIKKKENKDDK
ncbi:MAG: hypothetical protein KDC49_06745 [Saprospiraceae bacterium]|nr:hypothetical protein [Saprospiraceae bacterium]